MDRNAKALIATFLLVAGVLLGINYMVSENPDRNWIAWIILFFGLAIAFWLWIRREDRERQIGGALGTSEEARSRLEASERAARQIAEQESQRIEEALQQAGVEPQEPAEDTEMVDKDEAFADHPQPGPVEDKEAPVADTPVEERAKEGEPPGEQIVDEAMNGEKVSESQVSDAEARKPTREEDTVIEPDDAPEDVVEREPTTSAEKEAAEAEATGEPDDLTLIEGIGPKYRDALIEGGVDTFAKLAALSYDEIVAIAKAAGMRRAASMETWVEQARLAAAGQWDELEKLKEDLTGGRRE